jgi:hypothetical protein
MSYDAGYHGDENWLICRRADVEDRLRAIREGCDALPDPTEIRVYQQALGAVFDAWRELLALPSWPPDLEAEAWAVTRRMWEAHRAQLQFSLPPDLACLFVTPESRGMGRLRSLLPRVRPRRRRS